MAEATPARQRRKAAPDQALLSPPGERYFDPAAFSALVEMHHDRYVRRAPEDFAADPIRIRDRAHRWADRLRRLRPADPLGRPLLTSRDVEHAAGAGLAVYSMDRYGLAYDYLARHSDPAVATLVREVTADVRLDAGPRMLEAEARVASASELAQLARLAELYETGLAIRAKVEGDARWLVGKSGDCTRDWLVRTWADHATRTTAASRRLLPRGLPDPLGVRDSVESLSAWLFAASELRGVRGIRRRLALRP